MLSFVWATIRFTCVVLMHKLYILYFGLFVVRGVPLVQLIAHDLSKFSGAELDGYVRHLYLDATSVDGAERAARKRAFERAFDHHQMCNGHHCEHWLARDSSGHVMEDEALASDIPEVFVREMVVDWMAANAAYSPRSSGRINHVWLERFLAAATLTRTTRERIMRVLSEVGELSDGVRGALLRTTD
jgi:hypothetical protein